MKDYFESVCDRVLSHFADENWCKALKESSFTRGITALTNMYHEVAVGDDSDVVSGYANELVLGLTSCKVFIRSHRNFEKMKNLTLSKYLSLEPHLETTCDFLEKSARLTLPFSLKILRLRNIIFQSYAKNFDFSMALDAMGEFDGDEMDACEDDSKRTVVAMKDKQKLSGFLRNSFGMCFQHNWSRYDQEADSGQRTKVMKDVCASFKDCVDEVEEIFDDGSAEGFVSDSRDFLKLLQAGDGTVSSRAVKKAKSYLESEPRVKVYSSLLEETQIGRDAMECVAKLLEVSANDEVGDKRAENAKSALESKTHMVCIDKSGGGVPVLRTSGLLLDGSIWGLLDEVFANLLECKRVWSHARADEACADIAEPVREKMMDAFIAGHFCLRYWLYHEFQPLFAAMASDSDQLNLTEVFEAMRPALVTLSNACRKMFSLKGLKGVIDVYESMMEKGVGEHQNLFLRTIFTAADLEWFSKALVSVSMIFK